MSRKAWWEAGSKPVLDLPSTAKLVITETVDVSKIDPPKSNIPGCLIMSSNNGPSTCIRKEPVSQLDRTFK